MSDLGTILTLGTSIGIATGLTYGYFVRRNYYRRLELYDNSWENDPAQRPRYY